MATSQNDYVLLLGSETVCLSSCILEKWAFLSCLWESQSQLTKMNLEGWIRTQRWIRRAYSLTQQVALMFIRHEVFLRCAAVLRPPFHPRKKTFSPCKGQYPFCTVHAQCWLFCPHLKGLPDLHMNGGFKHLKCPIGNSEASRACAGGITLPPIHPYRRRQCTAYFLGSCTSEREDKSMVSRGRSC